jgi:hypothetical protein
MDFYPQIAINRFAFVMKIVYVYCLLWGTKWAFKHYLDELRDCRERVDSRSLVNYSVIFSVRLSLAHPTNAMIIYYPQRCIVSARNLFSTEKSPSWRFTARPRKASTKKKVKNRCLLF